jgi:hypothetical protein
MDNKIFAVKKNFDWWAVIDCGETKQGGMTVGNYWKTHFRKDGRTYRWFRKIILTPDNLQEWQEIKVREENICRIINDGETNILKFEGWDDTEDGGLQTLQEFAKLLGHELSLDDVRGLINET